MAFNDTGTFVRLYNWVTDLGNSVAVTASRMDGEQDGFATGLSNCITKDGQTTISANIPFNSKKITGLSDGSARTDSIALGQVQDNAYGTLGTAGGAADAYTATPSPVITTYATGSKFIIKIQADNTGASTLDINAIGTKDIKKYDGAGAKRALIAGDAQQDQYYELIYDGTDFVVLNPSRPYSITTENDLNVTGALAVTGTLTAQAASTSTPGLVEEATQAEMEAETDAKTPDAASLKYHPGVAKAWVNFQGSGTVTILDYYNISTIQDNGAGDWVITFATGFSNATYSAVCSGYQASGNAPVVVGRNGNRTVTATTFPVTAAQSTTRIDLGNIMLAFYGDQ